MMIPKEQSQQYLTVYVMLTTFDQAMLNSIDYVTCMLVNESSEIIHVIILFNE